MDAKKIRNAGVISTLSLALALGVGFASSMSAGAQGQTPTGNDKPDGDHPIITSINGYRLTLATSPETSDEMLADAATVVVKDGKFAGFSALKVGDKIQINPRITLPNGLEGHGMNLSAPQEPSQADPSNPDKSRDLRNNDPGSGQPDDPEGTASPNTPAAPEDPNNKDTGKVADTPTDASLLPGEGSATQSSSTISVIWVASSNDVLLGGTVYWVQGDTAVLNIPGVAYSEYVIHTSNGTGYQKMPSISSAPATANAADLAVGASVVVLGNDGGSSNAGFFTAKAILILPASGK